MLTKLNCGFVFSQLVDLKSYIFLCVLLIFASGLVFLKRSKSRSLNLLGFLLLVVGAVLNLYQRVTNGCVVDNFRLTDSVYFNLADVILLLGIVFLTGGVFYEQDSSTN